MRKNFCLDTNVLLHDAWSIFKFEDNHVIIPICVIEELDTFKKLSDETGRNAREVSRSLDRLRLEGNLAQGVPLESGGSLRVEMHHLGNEALNGLRDNADNRILATALYLKQNEPGVPAVIVTKDVNLRIKADSLGVATEDYENDQTPIEELYSGYTELSVDKEQLDTLYRSGHLPIDQALFPNQFAIVRNGGSNGSALARFESQHNQLVSLRQDSRPVWGVTARNKEQKFALDLLLNDQIQLVTMIGVAGTGKTLLAIAAGLEKVLEESVYKKVLITRPVIPVGRDIGYLPGDLDEKLSPWMQPIYDNLNYLTASHHNQKFEHNGRQMPAHPSTNYQTQQYLQDLGMLEVESLTHIRGRSIPNQYIIVDEAQNLTPHEAKTILTRAGEGTKLVFVGDPYQIDHPYLDSCSNGLTFVVDRFKRELLSGHVTLKKGERSHLAEMAARLL